MPLQIAMRLRGDHRSGPREDRFLPVSWPRCSRSGSLTVSQHLTQLRTAGLVISQRLGVHVYRRVRPEALPALCTVLNPECCRWTRVRSETVFVGMGGSAVLLR